MDGFIFYLLVFGLIIVIPSLILYFLYNWLAKKGYRWLGIIVVVSVVVFLVYNIYTAIYPTDNFYFDDFKAVTLREIPKSAVVIDKTASYPDMHGKYVSCSLMKLSGQDYTILLNELSADKRMLKNADIIYSEEWKEIMKNKNEKDIKYSFARNANGEPDNFSYIGFFDDQETIIVYFLKN